MMEKKIRVLVVDDSVFFREFMSRALSASPAVEVVGVASDAFEANEKITKLLPDVITLDIEMPKVRGTDFLRKLRPKFPDIKIVVISSVSGAVFEALQAGAVDFVAKPGKQTNMDNSAFISETISKIKIAAAVNFTKTTAPKSVPEPQKAPAAKPPAAVPFPATLKSKNANAIIAIGASTGGTEAIFEVIKNLPAATPGIVIVQHMPPVFTQMYATRLDNTCKMSVKEAADGDRVMPGLVLIAPGGAKHMHLKKDSLGYFVRLVPGAKVNGHCPSVDVLFESVANICGKDAIGVILTGMGADGAKNLLAMKKRGAHTIGQDQGSCVVYGMPMVAYDIGGVTEQLPLGEISGAILRRLNQM